MMRLIWILPVLILPSYQISEKNCLRENPGILDADFNIISKYEYYWKATEEDIIKQAELFSSRFKRAHLWLGLNSDWTKNLLRGVSRYIKSSNNDFQLFTKAVFIHNNLNVTSAARQLKEDYEEAMQYNNNVDRPVAGVYMRFLTTRFEHEIEAIESAFGTKENSTYRIGANLLDCFPMFKNTRTFPFLRRLNFLNCRIYPQNKSTPEISADNVMTDCDNLQYLAKSINVMADIMCSVAFPSYGISENGIVGSVSHFQRFWCRILDRIIIRNNSQSQIIMYSAFDKPYGQFKEDETDHHYGWWRRRLANTYEPNAFVEKVEELEGGREHGKCTAECSACNSTEECCEGRNCSAEFSFQPFENGQHQLACISIGKECAPRVPKTRRVVVGSKSSSSALPASGSEPISVLIYFSVAAFILCVLLVLGTIGFIRYDRKRTEKVGNQEAAFKDTFDGISASIATLGLMTGHKDTLKKICDLPCNLDLEIQRDNFVIYEDKLLGSGEFGVVLEGRIGNESVAVKTTLPGASGAYLKALLMELKVLMYLGQHNNIVNLRGMHTTQLHSGKLYLFLELCPLGDLLQFLRKHRDRFSFSNDSVPDKNFEHSQVNRLTSKHLLLWSVQIARAMEHLADKNVIHADIASRNILMFSTENVKLTDFGLSRRLYDYANYVKKKQGPLPWRHMSIETLTDSQMSVKSDVWSFGVTMWEMFSLGKVPYPGHTFTHDFVELLIDGLRLECPPYSNPLIYEVMSSCWTADARERPSIMLVHTKLVSVLNELYTKQIYLCVSEVN